MKKHEQALVDSVYRRTMSNYNEIQYLKARIDELEAGMSAHRLLLIDLSNLSKKITKAVRGK